LAAAEPGTVLLVPQTQIRDELTVSLGVRALQILEKAPPPAHHLEQASPAVVILLVLVEVRSEVVD
jgi:DNA-directed RNA polymerase subunit K/omega